MSYLFKRLPAFQALVKKDLLVTSGHGRGTVYCLPGQSLPTPDQAFGGSGVVSSQSMSGGEEPSYGHLSGSSGHLGEGSGHSRRENGGWLSVDGLSKSLIDKLDSLDPHVRQELMIEAAEAREKGKLPREEMVEIILDLCEEYYLTLPVLCELLNRKSDPLRKNYLKPLVDAGRLSLAFPTTPTNPRQAYTATIEH